MKLSLAELAEHIGGKLTGSGDVQIAGADTLRNAGPQDITLANDAKLANALAQSSAVAVIVPSTFQPENIAYITVDNPTSAFAQVVAKFRPPCQTEFSGISPAAHVNSSATIASDVTIGPGAFVGDKVTIGRGTTIYPGVSVMAGTQIGADVTIFPNAVLYENTQVGDRCVIHAGAVLGAFGFGYDSQSTSHHLSPQLGHVSLGDDVEIGAATTVDRGTFGATSIGEGTKLDNLVMIGHNCRIGRHNLICSQVGIAGSCTTGDFVVMAGQVGVRDHVEIGDQAMIGARSGVSNDLTGGERYLGAPAIPARRQMQILFSLQKLPEMKRHLKSIRRQIDTLLAEQEADTPQPDSTPKSSDTPRADAA